VTQASVVDTRFKLWLRACLAYGFNVIPPLTAKAYAQLLPGVVGVHAKRSAVLDGERVAVTLDVDEYWIPGDDPDLREDLSSQGCFIVALRWHVQAGAKTSAVGSERLDVVERTDAVHPRVHRHPYGCPNHMREATHVRPPEQWLSFVDTVLAGALGDHLLTWDQDAED